MKLLTYKGSLREAPANCSVVGYVDDDIVVISVSGELYAIHYRHLADMQQGYSATAIPENYVVFDVETMGLTAGRDKIIEIAAIKYQHFAETDRFETLVNPMTYISPLISGINGITNDMVADSPLIGDVLPGFLAFIADLPLVAHNAPFDVGVVAKECGNTHKKPDNEVIDTLKLARRCFPMLASHSLDNLKRNLAMEQRVAHRALSDAYATAELLHICNRKARE